MIQRYEIETVGQDWCTSEAMCKNDDGDYVLYTDHVEAVKQARRHMQDHVELLAGKHDGILDNLFSCCQESGRRDSPTAPDYY